VGVLEGGDGAGLDEELVHADQPANVAGGHVFDGLHVTAHHQDGTLNGLLVQVLLLAGGVVGAHDAGLHSRRDLAGEHSAERVETTLVRGGHHFRHVHHEGGVGVAVLKNRKIPVGASYNGEGGYSRPAGFSTL